MDTEERWKDFTRQAEKQPGIAYPERYVAAMRKRYRDPRDLSCSWYQDPEAVNLEEVQRATQRRPRELYKYPPKGAMTWEEFKNAGGRLPWETDPKSGSSEESP